MTRPGPKTPEGLARVSQTIQRVNAEGRNIRGPGDPHGVHAISLAQPETRALAEHIIEILEGEGLGHIRPADRTAVELLAVCLRKIRQAEAYLDRHGLVGRSGAVRPVAQLLVRLLREARGYCEALGMTPAARARLGLETGKAFDIAAALAAMREAPR
jgi:hypothetical protein